MSDDLPSPFMLRCQATHRVVPERCGENIEGGCGAQCSSRQSFDEICAHDKNEAI